MSPLRWTCKSTRQLARLLTAEGHPVSHMTVAQLLHGLRYSLQGNDKTKEGKQHPDRDARFRYIQRQGANRQRIASSERLSIRHRIAALNVCGNRQRPRGQVSVSRSTTCRASALALAR